MGPLYGVPGPHHFQVGALRAGGPPPAPGGARAGFDLRGFVLARLCQPCGNARVEQVGEALSEVRALHLVIHDPEAGEDGLVELSADIGRCGEVQPVRVGAEQ
ncbi:hypothetical protein JQK87_09355 [Streptomyces sp. G44]|uniref:hypothetical protein n=1 Tax=Streptomyces sp. G44 TaxID=2807632 RepID=UPI0019607F86|nr:hypothetical protein [Streptomyces sp. G44]MBM7168616.1 hypothetical protein [Streptomyces sp. G44]